MSDLIIDTETLDVEPSSLILSCGIILVDFDKNFTIDDLKNRSIFVKFDAKSQTKTRTVSTDTLAWWREQPIEVQRQNLLPSPVDVSLSEGYAALRKFIQLNVIDPKKPVYWCRGHLDSSVLEDVAVQLGLPKLFPHYRYRDIRTAIDILYGSDNGYCDTNPPLPDGLNPHNPVDDCIRDAWLLKYGVEK